MKKLRKKKMADIENKEILKEYMLKEIEIIQDIIKRMASNSFMMKGWAITLVVVTLLLRGSEDQVLNCFYSLISFLVFGCIFFVAGKVV
jgi:CHASE2 domain-containing sensor protein